MLPVQQKLFMITSTIIEDNFKHQIVVVSNKTKKKKKRLSKYYLHLNIFLQILTSSVKLLIGKWQEKKTIFLIIHKKIDEKVTFFITFLKFYMLLEKTVSGKFRVGCKYFCCCCCCQYLFVINVDLSLLIALIMSAIKRRVMKKKTEQVTCIDDVIKVLLLLQILSSKIQWIVRYQLSERNEKKLFNTRI